MVLASLSFAASDLSWDEIKKVTKYQSSDITDPKFAASLCFPEEMDEITVNAFNRFYVKPKGAEPTIVPADSEEDAAMIVYCEAYNSGKEIPESFEVKGPILSRVSPN